MKDICDMKTLQIFLEVAKLRSVSQAADLAGISQSAASQRIAHLEKKLNVTLLDRSVRPLTVTSAGEVFLQGAKELIKGYELLEQRVSRLKPRLEGRVRIESIYSAGIDLMQQIAESFSEAHPKVVVELHYHRPDAVHESVKQGRCDLGIVSYPKLWRDVGVIPLREEEMAVVCAPGHELAVAARCGSGEPVDAGDLHRFELVTLESDMPLGRDIRRYLKQHGPDHATPNIAHEFDNLDTIKSVVAVTDKISILPRRAARYEVAGGTLSLLSLSPMISRPLGVIYDKQPRANRARPQSNGRASRYGAMSTVAEAFLEYMIERVREDCAADRDADRNADRNVDVNINNNTISNANANANTNTDTNTNANAKTNANTKTNANANTSTNTNANAMTDITINTNSDTQESDERLSVTAAEDLRPVGDMK